MLDSVHPQGRTPGDSLVVTRVDRVARSLVDQQIIVHAIKAKGAVLKAAEQPINTSSAAEKAFLDMLGVFAEFETNLRKEHQLKASLRRRPRVSTKAVRQRSRRRRC